jgi:peptide/nickel transport system substrate-binding protein
MKEGFFKVTRLVITLLTFTPLVLISDIGDTATTPSPKTPAVQTSTPKMTPKYGGTLIIRHTMPTSMGYPPTSSSIADLDHSPICVDTLLRFDKQGKPVPWLATAWKYSSDSKFLLLTLRKDVKFHDGTDFNAAAVKTNLDLCLAAKRGELASVSSVEVGDNYTVRLNLSSVDAYLLTNLGEIVGLMISPAALAKGADYCRTNPVGTGPFKQVSYQSGVKVRFEKWSGYWQKGKPYLDAVEIVNIPDDMTAMAAFKKGEITTMSTRDAALLKDLKDANVASLASYLTLAPDSAHKDSPFSDLKVRQAVAYAIDCGTLQKSFGGELWSYSNQLVDKSSVYYNPKITGYPYNLQKAKQVLAASRYPNGFKMDLTYSTSYNNGLLAAAIQSMLAKINIQVTLKPVGSAQATALRSDGWQNGLLAIALGTDPAKDPGRELASKLAKDSGMYSVVDRSAKYDALLASTIKELDFNKRVALNQQLMKQQIDGECMVYYVFNNGWCYIKSPNLKDANRGDIWYHQWTAEDAWLNK